MNLSNKLRRFVPQQTNAPLVVPKQSAQLDPFLQGQEMWTPYGPCYVREKHLPLVEKHGHWSLESVSNTDYAHLRRLDQRLTTEFNLFNALFLDTETTGLSGGTGTYAFLVGLGFFTPSHFVVKQLLMRDYNEELALLHLLGQELETRSTILSFNGKTFDLPLLQTRFTLARFGSSVTNIKNHIDLLHISRRIWRQKLESCSLSSLEENILGVTRSDDIPGFEIPQRYFQFLQTGQGELLQTIVEHNYIDIVSLATLLYRLHSTVELSPAECDCPYESEALAHLSILAGEYCTALSYLDVAKQLTEENEHYLAILRTTASIHKRLGDYGRASQLWKKILELAEGDLATSEELAKYYEHRSKDLHSAEQVTRRALAIAWQTRSSKTPHLEYRLRRLENKTRKASTL